MKITRFMDLPNESEDSEKEITIDFEKANPQTIIEKLGHIAACLQNFRITDEFYEKVGPHLNAIADFLVVSPVQAILFTIVLEKSDNIRGITIDNIAKTLGCSKIESLKYEEDFEWLIERKLVRKIENDRYGTKYLIYSQNVIKALRKGEFWEFTEYNNIDVERFWNLIGEFFEKIEEDKMDKTEFINEFNDLAKSNPKLPFINKIEEYGVNKNFVDYSALLFFCSELVNHERDSLEVNGFYGGNFSELKGLLGVAEYSVFKSALKTQKQNLMKIGFIENDITSEGMVKPETYRLTNKARQEFLGDIKLAQKEIQRDSDFLLWEKLTPKTLFFDGKTEKSIKEIYDFLSEEKFAGVQQRLLDNKMRSGFACIFYGAPGTGKTESVYQIARETQRDILAVDMSSIKNKFVGESEKNTKMIFTRYRSFVEDYKKAGKPIPILLLNEADALISKRLNTDNANPTIAQMQNTMQNIILQEMEMLNGILIATTNLTDNMDSAFERRFLYKVEFTKPSTEVKTAIWQSIIPSLSGEDARTLAIRYDFSGGQIENIARKQMVSSILYGKESTLNDICVFCDEEKFEKENGRKMGF